MNTHFQVQWYTSTDLQQYEKSDKGRWIILPLLFNNWDVGRFFHLVSSIVILREKNLQFFFLLPSTRSGQLKYAGLHLIHCLPVDDLFFPFLSFFWSTTTNESKVLLTDHGRMKYFIIVSTFRMTQSPSTGYEDSVNYWMSLKIK